MKWLLTIPVLMSVLVLMGAMQREAEPRFRFDTVEIVLDTKDLPLAAYQLELRAVSGEAKIVGIEGGEHPEFAEPPYYDPEAMQNERVIIGAFSTADAAALPSGKIRVATIHLQIAGDAPLEFEAQLHVAADSTGRAIEAEVQYNMGSER